MDANGDVEADDAVNRDDVAGGAGSAEALVMRMAETCGFEHIGVCDAQDLQVREEVRAMCASNKCQAYGKNWRCPPYCGELSYYAAQIAEKQRVIVTQTVVQLEDDFDVEAMLEGERTHQDRFRTLLFELSKREDEAKQKLGFLALGAGTCTLCDACTCPDNPCRFPQIATTSMESAGLVVADVCTAAGIAYYHGKGTLAYTSCVLV